MSFQEWLAVTLIKDTIGHCMVATRALLDPAAQRLSGNQPCFASSWRQARRRWATSRGRRFFSAQAKSQS
jgi:hypothetical protein